MKKDVAAIARSRFVDGLFLTVLSSMNALLDTSNELDTGKCQTKYEVYRKTANSNHDSATN
ncbi:hypothetical protein [Nostoc sp. DSM 114159]